MKTPSILLLLLILTACGSSQETEESSEEQKEVIEFYGNTQGTTFAVIVNDDIDLEMQEIENTLKDFDLALSGYIPNSIISNLNEAPAGLFSYEDKLGYFNRCYQLSLDVYKLTKGSFDPAVYPLVEGWGFMEDVENIPDSVTIDSLRTLTGFANGYHFNFLMEGIEGDTVPISKIIKNTPAAKLDFNAIAQGLAVDVLAELIESKGGKNYFVEIGGEIRVSGKNRDGNLWRIGIDKPIENSTAENRELQEIVNLDNKSIATSGSYRKFYEKNGVKYSHTLDPHTGYPVTHSLLSATVVADNCAMADAMATALMVMGPDRGIDFVNDNKELGLEVYLVFINKKGRTEIYSSKGFSEIIAQ